MKKDIKNARYFGGKKYGYFGSRHFKDDAEKKAKELRKAGMLARVIRLDKPTYPGLNNWGIWYR